MQLMQNPGYNSLLILIWEGSYCITSFCWLLINSGIKEKNVRHGLLGFSIQTVKRPNKGCCLFC